MVYNKQEMCYVSKHSADGIYIWIKIFELNETIYFIVSNIFCVVSIQNFGNVLV